MNSTIREHIRTLVSALPLSPGVYQFVDSRGVIIYVGKAKSLRKRVSSYFVENRDHSAKLRVMVKQIVDIRHIVVDTEQDALLLENSLIKKLQPRYNILLKDDKTYPWIVIRGEEFPRVESTRELRRDGSEYYGPYGSIATQRSILEFIRGVIPLRTCKLALNERSIALGRFNTCLQHQIGNCNAPCIGAESAEDYITTVARCNEFSERIRKAAISKGNEKYAELLLLSVRQIMAAHKLVVDGEGNILEHLMVTEAFFQVLHLQNVLFSHWALHLLSPG